MTAFPFETADDEEARDLGVLARKVQLARLIVNAALPLEMPQVRPSREHIPVVAQVAEGDILNLRGEAFAQVLAELLEHEYAARQAVMAALSAGQMPSS